MKKTSKVKLSFLMTIGLIFLFALTCYGVDNLPKRATANAKVVKKNLSPVQATITSLNGWEVRDLNDLVDASIIAQALVGTNMPISNVEFKGSLNSAGLFNTQGNYIGFESGIVLGSGSVKNVAGPNKYDSTSSSNNIPGDADLTQLVNAPTYDASSLQFDFVPGSNVISFQYVFSSEEYNEYVYSFNDVFGFFVNGVNVANIPGSTVAVSINTVNGGNPFGGTNASNSKYFRNNDLSDGGGSINTEMDGVTVIFNVVAPVNVGVTNHLKLAIADTSDSALDSNVFIKSESLIDDPNLPPVAVDDNITVNQNTTTILNVLANDTDPDNDLLTIEAITPATKGTAVISQDKKTLNYTPNLNYTGADSFTYTINDGSGGVATALVSITVNPVNTGTLFGYGVAKSPVGAFLTNPTLAGTTTVVFNAKYNNGVLNGKAGLQLRQSNLTYLNFASTSVAELFISGNIANIRGSGTVNGIGNYGFFISALDGQLNNGGGTDKFRFKIWDKVSGDIIYDNQRVDAENAPPTNILSTGLIAIGQ